MHAPLGVYTNTDCGKKLDPRGDVSNKRRPTEELDFDAQLEADIKNRSKKFRLVPIAANIRFAVVIAYGCFLKQFRVEMLH